LAAPLWINLVKIDVIIARKIEAPVDTQHTGPSAEVFLLLLVAKHQKRSIRGDISADPAVRRFRGAYVANCSDRTCQDVDLIVSNTGKLDDERRGTCRGGQHFALAKLDLAREECDSENCRRNRPRRQA
jgi:hypothetical protein